jgi:hypothetical protein
MGSTVLTSQAKEVLRKKVRALRAQLLEELLDAVKGEYQLGLPPEKAKLPEARRCRRERLDGWLEEQVRAASGAGPSSGKSKGKVKSTPKATKGHGAEALRQRFLEQAAKEAAHTLLNRLVFLRILEHHGVLHPAVVTGGWQSAAYEQEFVHYAGPLGTDDTRGYAALLEAVYAELALELPGLFGNVGLTALFPVPAGTLRAVIDALNDPALESAWGDDTTLGWVYQYWNDPEREALDAKIAGGGKIEPHEIASKTQMFTERYMVEWLLQNSLGLTWLCICRKNGWTADAEEVLPELDRRRAEWRAKRDAGEVALDALMPIHGALEEAWKYYVPQPIPEDAVAKAPSSIREVKLLDPACGSGHFLVISFGLFVGMYAEEARRRGEDWPIEQIAESILANNLHGIDIDPRAIQLAAAGLWLKAKLFAPKAEVRRLNLVAPCFRLGSLPKDDPALVKLGQELGKLGVSLELTEKLFEALKGVDHLGTLLRVDDAISKLLDEKESEGPLLAYAVKKQRAKLENRVAEFLGAHAAEADLGLRLEGEQLAAGLRFVRMVKEGTYDVVVGNPPYQGLPKTAVFDYVVEHYPRGRADLYAAFLERALELVRDGGISALLTMRGWMFLGQFAELRKRLVERLDLRLIGDLDRGAFEDVPDEVLATVMSVLRRADPCTMPSIAIQPTPLEDRSRDSQRTARKRAAVLSHVGRFEFDPKGFEVIKDEPIVYWWSRDFLGRYANAPKLGETAPVRQGMPTSNNARHLRRPWELPWKSVVKPTLVDTHSPRLRFQLSWVPYVRGAAGRAWLEPVDDMVRWVRNGFEIKVAAEHAYGSASKRVQSEDKYFTRGVAFTMVGSAFAARAHRFPGVIGDKGSSVYADNLAACLCVMNRRSSRNVLESINPSISFQVGDVNRLPVFPVADAEGIFSSIDSSFTIHESAREPSVEFRTPAPSPWRYAQAWAQRAVDRPENTPLPPYDPEYDPPAPEAHVSFAIGVALGRFGSNGEGILDTPPADALPAGIFFVSASEHLPDSLRHPAASRILAAWDEHSAAILGDKRLSLRDWLRKPFFEYHKGLYENRPIYFPLSSEKRSFVAYVSIHRWADNTLQTLLADHLNPSLVQLDGEISDLNRARASSDKKTASGAEKQYATTKRLRDELADFIAAVTQCAERGAPPTDPACPPRETDAPFRMDLDDGVMINSAALWTLLNPQWADPKKWWKQLCQADTKDYDWAHLARRYFPARVDGKCRNDPSLAVAHACFWRCHPAKAYAWELRLQDEIRTDFLIDETDSNLHRAAFLKDHPDQASEIQANEQKRRERKASKADAEPDDGAEEPAELDEESP